MKESWVRVASGVDTKYQVLIPDLPGQGRTTPADALFNYSVGHQASRLHQFLETTVPADKKVHLVGCSMGVHTGDYAAKEISLFLKGKSPTGIALDKRKCVVFIGWIHLKTIQ